MAYLEYREADDLVVEIHKLEPQGVPLGHKVAYHEEFEPGHEYEFVVYVNEVNEDGVVTSTAEIRQNPKVVIELLKEVYKENADLRDAVDFLVLDALQGGV